MSGGLHDQQQRCQSPLLCNVQCSMITTRLPAVRRVDDGLAAGLATMI